MRKFVLRALGPIALGLLTATCAWGAVTVTWGANVVNLSVIPNPDAGQEPWIPEVWFGVLPISFSTMDPIVLTGAGNFKNSSGWLVEYVRLRQDVVNNTDQPWWDFHIVLDGGQFYKKWLVQSGWNASQHPTTFDYVVGTGSPVLPGQTFVDGVVLKVTGLDAEGNGTFTLTKWPTVPEAGGAAALLGGLAGMLTWLRRRRH